MHYIGSARCSWVRTSPARSSTRSLATLVTASSLPPALANRGGTPPVTIDGLRSMSLLQPAKIGNRLNYVGLVRLEMNDGRTGSGLAGKQEVNKIKISRVPLIESPC